MGLSTQKAWSLLQEQLEATPLRPMPWRPPELRLIGSKLDLYKVLVSEMMLQQTQVARAAPKYQEFISTYSDFTALAAARSVDVLKLWQGLGYNRRAKYLLEAAKGLSELSHTPTLEELMACKGIGRNTASAVRVYSQNESIVFVETNIRTVIGHYFFGNQKDSITDAQILEVMSAIVPSRDPRTWYYKMMDHGTVLKKQRTAGPMGQFSSYRKQSAFEGSRRQLRGKCLSLLVEGSKTTQSIVEATGDKQRTLSVLLDLQKEGLLAQDGTNWSVAE